MTKKEKARANGPIPNADLAITSEHNSHATGAQYRTDEETAFSAAMRRALERREALR